MVCIIVAHTTVLCCQLVTYSYLKFHQETSQVLTEGYYNVHIIFISLWLPTYWKGIQTLILSKFLPLMVMLAYTVAFKISMTIPTYWKGVQTLMSYISKSFLLMVVLAHILFPCYSFGMEFKMSNYSMLYNINVTGSYVV